MVGLQSLQPCWPAPADLYPTQPLECNTVAGHITLPADGQVLAYIMTAGFSRQKASVVTSELSLFR